MKCDVTSLHGPSGGLHWRRLLRFLLAKSYSDDLHFDVPSASVS